MSTSRFLSAQEAATAFLFSTTFHAHTICRSHVFYAVRSHLGQSQAAQQVPLCYHAVSLYSSIASAGRARRELAISSRRKSYRLRKVTLAWRSSLGKDRENTLLCGDSTVSRSRGSGVFGKRERERRRAGWQAGRFGVEAERRTHSFMWKDERRYWGAYKGSRRVSAGSDR